MVYLVKSDTRIGSDGNTPCSADQIRSATGVPDDTVKVSKRWRGRNFWQNKSIADNCQNCAGSSRRSGPIEPGSRDQNLFFWFAKIGMASAAGFGQFGKSPDHCNGYFLCIQILEKMYFDLYTK